MTYINFEVNGEQSLSELVERAVSSHKIVTLKTNGQKSNPAEYRGIRVFARNANLSTAGIMPLDSFHHQFHQALVEADYNSRDKIIDLVQDIKRLYC